MARNVHTGLLDLDGDLLGVVFGALRKMDCRRLMTSAYSTSESCQALLQTCKGIHSSAACLSQVTTLILYLDEKKHGSMASQMCAVPPGANVSRIWIAANEDLEFEAQCTLRAPSCRAMAPHTFAQAMAWHAEHCTPQQLQLQRITGLVLGGSVQLVGGGKGMWKAFMDSALAVLPNMSRLAVKADLGKGNGADHEFLACSPCHELRLTSLSVNPSNLVKLSVGGCANIGKLRSLKELTIAAGEVDGDGIKHLSSLTALESLHVRLQLTSADLSPLSSLKNLVSVRLENNGRYPGLQAMVSGCTKLRSLRLGGPMSYAKAMIHDVNLQSSTLQALEIDYYGDRLPDLSRMPALQSFTIYNWEWTRSGNSPLDLGEKLVPMLSYPSTLSFNLENIVLARSKLTPCSELLQSLPQNLFVPSLCKLKLENFLFEPHDLSCLLAKHLPAKKLVTVKCEFVSGSIWQEIEHLGTKHIDL